MAKRKHPSSNKGMLKTSMYLSVGRTIKRNPSRSIRVNKQKKVIIGRDGKIKGKEK